MKTSPAMLCRAMFSLTALLFLTGCVGIVPRPVSATKVDHGHKLAPADVAFIKPGVTTRAQVREQLGTNAVALPMDRAFAYGWEMKGGGFAWWWFFVTPYGGDGDAGTITGGWRALFIAFDNDGVVTAIAFKRPSPRRSLHEHLYDWVDSLPSMTAIASTP